MDRVEYCKDGKAINVPYMVVGSIPVFMPLVRANVPLNAVACFFKKRLCVVFPVS